jgi:CHAT domain-containing protein
VSVADPDRLPYLRSGLLFAGSGLDARNDGILTTEEVLGLDLSGVEWVVLSACDTGLGELRKIDGVLGLRRAFRMAGARTVIASLWPVDDRWAREWMEALYRARFVDRKSTPEAMQAASRAVLAELRSEGLEPLPRLWASFVAVGDSR